MGKSVVLLLLLILISCAPVQVQPEQPVVPIAEKAIVQCMDGSSAESLDKCPVKKQEVLAVSKPELKAEKTIMQELLEKAPANYWFSDDKYGAIVSGSLRNTGEHSPWMEPYTAVSYWDVNGKIVYLYAGKPIPGHWWLNYTTGKEVLAGLNKTYYAPFFQLNLTGNREIDETLMPKEFAKFYYGAKEGMLTNLIEAFYVKSPIDRMQEYQHELPIKVDEAESILPFYKALMNSNLSIEYADKEKPGETIIFRIDPEYHLALIIDEMKGKELVKRTRYFFDTVYSKRDEKMPVNETLVMLPSEYIIVTPEDYQEFLADLEGHAVN